MSRLDQFMQQMSDRGSQPERLEIGDGAVLADGGMAAYQGATYLEILNLGLTDEQMVEIMKLAVAAL